MHAISVLVIVAASFLNAMLTEGISWVLIYRTESYQAMRHNIEQLQKKIARTKAAALTAALNKSQQKKLERNEAQLKELTTAMSTSKFKSTFAIMFCLIALYNLLSSWFDGVVVAKLPFTPPGLLHGFTHRNLPGQDFTDCSFLFFYSLASIFMKANVQKYFGNVPRTPSVFENQQNSS